MGNKILVISKGFVHPSLFCRYHFKQLLLSLDNGFYFTFTDKLRAIENLKEKNFQGVILYYHEKKHCDHLLNEFKEFVAHGGGVLAIHSAMASFKENKEYQDILGGRFLGHGAVRELKVISKCKQLHTLKESLSFSITDELYIHEYHGSNRVLWACKYNGKEEPVVWTKTYGSGRVCYFSLGHRSKTFENKAVKEIISHALHWITGSGVDI